jgi:hypothetical protein
VVLAAREVLQRSAELRGDHDAEVDAVALRADAGLVRPGLDDLVGRVPRLEGLDDVVAVVAGDEDVDVADGGAPPTDGAGGVDARCGVDALEERDHPVGQGPGFPEQAPLA